MKQSNSLAMDDWKLKARAFVKLEGKSNVLVLASMHHVIFFAVAGGPTFGRLLFCLAVKQPLH